jgi:uncharacterized SAM-binding protein YcdF (DUF218 family)
MQLFEWSILGVALAALAVFVPMYRFRRTKLSTSAVFTLFWCAATVSVFLFAAEHLGRFTTAINLMFGVVVVAVLAMLAVVFLFGLYILLGYLLLNTVAIVRREGRGLQHMLTLLMALGVIAMMLAARFLPNVPVLQVLLYAAFGPFIYYALHLMQYLVSTYLCNFSRPKKNQDYIIVLGCGLKKDGTATPLLAARVDKAIQFYEKQKKKGAVPPKLVLSGGKGNDECRSDAVAMAAYAQGQGIPAERLLLEDQSRNTLENMRFSKAIMDADAGGSFYNCIYATSNYHVLRAGIYARRAGLRINGIGGKTAFYFLANAFLREYVAYLKLYLKWNVVLASLFMVLGGAFYFVLPWINAWISARIG